MEWHNSCVADTRDTAMRARMRQCNLSGCRVLFTIGAGCDQGQRYCTPECRAAARRRQRTEANRRNQQAEGGREAHRHCQKRFRERFAPPVTDQAMVSITTSNEDSPEHVTPCPVVCICLGCGKSSRWIDTSPILPRSWRGGRRPKNTFLDDR